MKREEEAAESDEEEVVESGEEGVEFGEASDDDEFPEFDEL